MTLRTIAPGDSSKADPFTILIVMSPGVETPWLSRVFAADLITSNQDAVDITAQYICDALFGRIPGQREVGLGSPGIGANVRVLGHFDNSLAVNDANSLIALDSDTRSTIVVPRRKPIAAFGTTLGIQADVVFAVSANTSNDRASAWPADDDLSRGGQNFELAGVALTNACHASVPGTAALHTTASSLTALHEFHNAMGSYQDGQITDLDVDVGPNINCKSGRPIPTAFGTYGGSLFRSDSDRDGLGYPADRISYHCELLDASKPAVMGNYWLATSPNACENDAITRAFVFDRVRAKLSR